MLPARSAGLSGDLPQHKNAALPGLPPSLTVGAEFRSRLEFPANVDFEPGRTGRYQLSRLRVSATLKAAPWMRFHVQAQDARGAGFENAAALESVEHHLDFRQAYADFGSEEGAWALRFGRQEIAFGDERLIGSDSYWDPLGQSFDGARLSYRRPGVAINGFAAFVVTPTTVGLSRPSTANRIHGVYASIEKGPLRSSIDPYVFWKSNRPVGNGIGPLGDSDVFTYGIRTAGALPARLDYNIEMALQGGHEDRESIRAWAGHWELGIRPFRAEPGPRFAAEYNFASGDDCPGDGLHTTFDDLYPAGYNKYGMADPFAARNLRNIAASAEWKWSERWNVSAGYRALWVASTRDGLYTKGDSWLLWNASAASGHVGNQVSVMASFDASEKLRFAAGYARLLPGPYLAESGYRGALGTPYVQMAYRFR